MFPGDIPSMNMLSLCRSVPDRDTDADDQNVSGQNSVRLRHEWEQVVPLLEFAFQPIVNIHSGVCYGYEALLRNVDKAGFDSPGRLFDAAYEEGTLFLLELLLREKAVTAFTSIQGFDQCRLFYNIDNRVIEMDDYREGETSSILGRNCLPPDLLCLEISEKHQFGPGGGRKEQLMRHYSGLFKVALDDFGTGYSGLQLLYHAEPDFIKIDRFFISGIDTDAKKKLFVSNIVGMSHVMGVLVIAEGVETAGELSSCRGIGCDLVQGFLVQRPVTDVKCLKARYDIVGDIHRRDRREVSRDRNLLYDRIEIIPPIVSGVDDMPTVFERFSRNENREVVPVVNTLGEPLGVIHDSMLKEYAYSPFGKELLKNPLFGKPLSDFIVPCPSVSVRMSAEKILEVFSYSEQSSGVMVVDNGAYIGYLSAFSLLRIINEKNIAAARDQNPLTKLPGNNSITSYISETLADENAGYMYIYFDLDNFKPFNDKYGFRRGDRAILLFAELLRERALCSPLFVGHIGGDDFFAGCRLDDSPDTVMVKDLCRVFSESAVPLYDKEDRDNGWIVSSDRDGNARLFPLLTATAVVISVGRGRTGITSEDISARIAELKKKAKASGERSILCRL
jgi:diguanylate cyclase (GGDEF)-like protein